MLSLGSLSVLLCTLPLLYAHPHVLKRDLASSGLTGASWIWLPSSTPSAFTSNAPVGSAYFVKPLTTPPGKTAATALITLTADNNFTLWVNGQPVGASDGSKPDSAWQTALQFSAALNASANVVAVMAYNAPDPANPQANPAGLVGAHVADDAARSAVVLPPGFPPSGASSATPLAGWAQADQAGTYASNVSPWGNQVSLASPATFGAQNLSASGVSWIYNNATAVTSAPVGFVGFRKTFSTPAGKTAASATVVATADNSFRLFVNGQYAGAPPFDDNAAGSVNQWVYAQRFTAIPLAASSNKFDIIAQNFESQQTPGAGSSAGLIAAILITFTDGSSQVLGTDSTWLASDALAGDPSSFTTSSSTQLKPASVLGAYGISPWGQLSGTSDVLNVALLPANAAAAPGASSASVSSASPVGASVTPTGPFTVTPALTSSLPSFVASPGPKPTSAGVSGGRMDLFSVLLGCLSVVVLM
ncbi:unnamed protein product [Mycena citricolor]|uniref:Uncharacterized protein n=1 Tax=Mycena citricolor TaxID=2018698 RepID=A0AAD2Q2T0_9AGAR|nr:unnamed protein product [Mycena citricolor]